jgi:hypothetical protein
MGRDSAVGMATRYVLDAPWIESRWSEIFHTRPDRPWGPPSLLYNGYRLFPGGKGGRGVTLTTHPQLLPRSWKSRAMPLLPLWARVTCYRVTPYLTLSNDHHFNVVGRAGVCNSDDEPHNPESRTKYSPFISELFIKRQALWVCWENRGG